MVGLPSSDSRAFIVLCMSKTSESSITLQMFADHDSSLNPIDVPREWIWNLPRRTVYFGTSVTTIFRGTERLVFKHLLHDHANGNDKIY